MVAKPVSTDEEGGMSADAPLMDAMAAAVKKMIGRGRDRGFVTYDELNAVLPAEKFSSEQIEDTLAMLSEMGINVVESEEREESETPTPSTSEAANEEEADKEAVDLYGFTSVLKRQADDADREKIVAMMWRLVYSDGALHEFEDNVIWRVAELLGVDPKARIRLKQAARGEATP